jgi:hypothetical protein
MIEQADSFFSYLIKIDKIFKGIIFFNIYLNLINFISHI